MFWIYSGKIFLIHLNFIHTMFVLFFLIAIQTLTTKKSENFSKQSIDQQNYLSVSIYFLN
jgi:hypothetical protein